MDNKSFNIYYLNFNKVYEIAMMINNIIPEKLEKEKGIKKEFYKRKSSSTEAALDSGEYLAKIKAISGNEKGKSISSSNKMVETLNVKTTKSILLRQIERKCKEYKDTGIKEGDLIKIDNVHLSIYEESNLREIQLLRKDALKGFSVEGLDMNNLISSMLRDYCYVLKGNVDGIKDQIILKIPMELDNEFENKYSIYDLLIGKVSIIGVYKQKVLGSEIYDSTFQYFTNIGEKSLKSETKVIESSETPNRIIKKEDKEKNTKYNFIDVIGIIQNIEFKEETQIKLKWYQKILRKFSRKKDEKLLNE